MEGDEGQIDKIGEGIYQVATTKVWGKLRWHALCWVKRSCTLLMYMENETPPGWWPP